MPIFSVSIAYSVYTIVFELAARGTMRILEKICRLVRPPLSWHAHTIEGRSIGPNGQLIGPVVHFQELQSGVQPLPAERFPPNAYRLADE
jgi:hypothetical protein